MLIVATVSVSELQWTVLVMFCMLPSVKVPVAVNCWVAPEGMVGIAGVTAMETRTAGVMVKVVEPVIEPDVAEIDVLPMAMLVAIPAVLTVAMVGSNVDQVAVAVRSRVLPSL